MDEHEKSVTPLSHPTALFVGGIFGLLAGLVIHQCLHVSELIMATLLGGGGLIWWVIIFATRIQLNSGDVNWEVAFVTFLICLAANALPWVVSMEFLAYSPEHVKAASATTTFALCFFLLTWTVYHRRIIPVAAASIFVSSYVYAAHTGWAYHNIDSDGLACFALIAWQCAIGVVFGHFHVKGNVRDIGPKPVEYRT